MVSIDEALTQVKGRPLAAGLDPDRIAELCRKHGHTWRERTLPPAVTLQLFAQQILHGPVSCQGVRHLAEADFSGTAYCQARARVPLGVYQDLLPWAAGNAALGRWHGHRTFHLDGTGFTLWDSQELREHFGLPGNVQEGCGFPVGHLLVCFDVATGLCQQAIPAPGRRGDLADVPALLEHLRRGDIFIGDESFGGYTVLALLDAGGRHGLFPVPHNRIVDFTAHRPWARENTPGSAGIPHSRWIKSLGWRDQLVEYHKPAHPPTWLAPEVWASLPETLVVRELRRRVSHPEAGTMELTMVTTLLDPQAYSPRALTQLRASRWEVETNIGYLKTRLGMDQLTSRTVEGVRKELCVFVWVYNLIRQVMLEAARRQKVAPRRISFADTLNCLRFWRSGQEWPILVVNPVRPWRIEPRVKKRRDKEYPYMTRPRPQCRQRAIERRRKRA